MPDDVNGLLKLLREDCEIITQKLERARTEGSGTPQEVADFREPVVQGFVRKYFPFPYRVTKGKIRDSYGAVSASVDCVLCNPVHPHTVEDDPNKFHLILADGVDAAVELKPDISRAKLLKEALEQSLSVKRLRRVRTTSLIIHADIDDGDALRQHALRVASFIYTTKHKADLLDTVREIIAFYRAEQIDHVDQVDAIVVHGVGILANYKLARDSLWNNFKKAGWFWEEWGPDTLAGFLIHLNNIYPCVTPLSPPVLGPYLNGARTKVFDIEELLRRAASGGLGKKGRLRS